MVVSDRYCTDADGVVNEVIDVGSAGVFLLKFDPQTGSAALWKNDRRNHEVRTVRDAVIRYAIDSGQAQQATSPKKGQMTPMAGNACSAIFTGTGIYFTIVGVLATIFIPYAVIPAAIAFGGLSAIAGFLGYAAC